MKEAESVEAENQKRMFQEDDDLFTDEFKGFEFNVNDEKITFKPADAAEFKRVSNHQ